MGQPLQVELQKQEIGLVFGLLLPTLEQLPQQPLLVTTERLARLQQLLQLLEVLIEVCDVGLFLEGVRRLSG